MNKKAGKLSQLTRFCYRLSLLGRKGILPNSSFPFGPGSRRRPRSMISIHSYRLIHIAVPLSYLGHSRLTALPSEEGSHTLIFLQSNREARISYRASALRQWEDKTRD